MSVSARLDELAVLLKTAGQQMCTDVMKSDRLSRERRLYLESWGRLLQESAMWVWLQAEANLLGEADIVKVVELQADVAETYLAHETPSSG